MKKGANVETKFRVRSLPLLPRRSKSTGHCSPGGDPPSQRHRPPLRQRRMARLFFTALQVAACSAWSTSSSPWVPTSKPRTVRCSAAPPLQFHTSRRDTACGSSHSRGHIIAPVPHTCFCYYPCSAVHPFSCERRRARPDHAPHPVRFANLRPPLGAQGRTALNCAVNGEHLVTAKHLVEKGADVKALVVRAQSPRRFLPLLPLSLPALLYAHVRRESSLDHPIIPLATPTMETLLRSPCNNGLPVTALPQQKVHRPALLPAYPIAPQQCAESCPLPCCSPQTPTAHDHLLACATRPQHSHPDPNGVSVCVLTPRCGLA
jgi:hypothetical protein